MPESPQCLDLTLSRLRRQKLTHSRRTRYIAVTGPSGGMHRVGGPIAQHVPNYCTPYRFGILTFSFMY